MNLSGLQIPCSKLLSLLALYFKCSRIDNLSLFTPKMHLVLTVVRAMNANILQRKVDCL